MKLYRLIKQDILGNVLMNKRFILILIFTFVSCFQTKGYLFNIDANTKNTIGDFALFLLKGEDPFVITQEMEYPLYWIAFVISALFTTTGLLQKDLQGYGVQILLRGQEKRLWWLSKCVTIIIMTIYAYVVSYAAFLAYCILEKNSLSLKLTDTVLFEVANGTYAQAQAALPNSVSEQIILIIVLPVFILIAMNMIQMVLSILFGPIVSFSVLVGYMVMALFVVSPYVLPAYLMINHSSSIIVGGLNCKTGIIVSVITSLSMAIFGEILFYKKDIIERDRIDD